MTRLIVLIFMAFALGAGVPAHAQTKHSKAKPTKGAPRKIYMPQAYLGTSELKGGAVPREQLAEMLRQGVTAHDSTGKQFQVAGFEFNYAERMLYEDSTGNLMVVVDYLSEYCPGNKLSEGISASIYDRLKPGDTVYIERVSLIRPGGGTAAEDDEFSGKGLKFGITK
jgi:hypothetical protein